MATTKTTGTVNPETEELTRQVEALQRDLKGITRTIGDLTNSKVEKVKGDALDTARQAEEAVRANPLAAVGIALGLGIIFGMMTRR